ncbi:hypothetical protein LINGRAHAP2_LOCUS35903 [Linum grandiflorum]
MAKSFIVCFFLVFMICASLDETKMIAEAKDCFASWDCLKGEDRCRAECSWRYAGKGSCPDHPVPMPHLCIYEMNMMVEARQCVTSWDCLGGEARCQAKCSWRYGTTAKGHCPITPVPGTYLCTCFYDC